MPFVCAYWWDRQKCGEQMVCIVHGGITVLAVVCLRVRLLIDAECQFFFQLEHRLGASWPWSKILTGVGLRWVVLICCVVWLLELTLSRLDEPGLHASSAWLHGSCLLLL